MTNTPPTFPLLAAVLFGLVFAGCVLALHRDRVRLWVFLVTVTVFAGILAVTWLCFTPRVHYHDLVRSGIANGLLWGGSAAMALLTLALWRMEKTGEGETLLRGPRGLLLWATNWLVAWLFCYWLLDSPDLGDSETLIAFAGFSAAAAALPYSLTHDWLERRLHRRYVAQRLGLAQQPSPSLFRRLLLAAGLVARGTERASDELIKSRRQRLVKLLIGACALFFLEPVLGHWVNVIILAVMAAAGVAGLVLLAAWLLRRCRSRPPKPARPLLPLPLTCPLPTLDQSRTAAVANQHRSGFMRAIAGFVSLQIPGALIWGGIVSVVLYFIIVGYLNAHPAPNPYGYHLAINEIRAANVRHALASAVSIPPALLIVRALFPWSWIYRRRHMLLLQPACICLVAALIWYMPYVLRVIATAGHASLHGGRLGGINAWLELL